MTTEIYEEEALKMLSPIYDRILKVNLTQDCYVEIKGLPTGREDGNGGFEKTSKWTEGIAGEAPVHPDDAERYRLFTDLDYLRAAFQKGNRRIGCHYRRKTDGGYRWVSMELIPAPEYRDDDQIVYLYLKDIHEEFTADIENMDFLTGALNRRGFLHEARLFLDAADAPGDYAVVIFDIKGFKSVNEFFGTAVGDEVLREMYRHFKYSALQPVLVARTEGDHFLCLVDRARLDVDYLPEICKTSLTLENREIQLYIRCGIYPIEDKTLPVSTMCDYAKIAMQHIFDEYIKPYAVFEESMRVNYIIRSEIQGRVQSALENGEFEVYYQPIYDARTGELTSAEALIRWNYPGKGIISPGVFIPVLEESGQITQVDGFVLNEVRKFYAQYQKEGKRMVPISINLSWMDFYDSQMMDTIFMSLRNDNYDIQPRFEVTETAYAAMSAHEANLIADLREAGAQILLDDFGSGCSSFSTFSAYDFDIIKLDMGFVQKIGTDSKTKSIIHSIIDMSHHMNARVIAEGVETQSQLDFLSRHGCDYIQGYYFSRPLPRRDFEKMLVKEPDDKGIPGRAKGPTLTDYIPVEILQKIQDAFSSMTGMAALTTDKDGIAVTKGSNFTTFCMEYTRQSKIGRPRCEQCDKKGAELAFHKGRSCVYECHAGLMDYAAPIIVEGEMIGCFIGGQVLPDKPNPEKYRKIAEEIGVDPEGYLKALDTVYILERETIDRAANFLYVTANVLSDIAYNRYKADMSNELLREKNTQLDYLANYDVLTRLNNRRRFPAYFREYQQSEKPYCIVLGDIDSFKSVNDTYGHECGDTVLSELAAEIKNNLPDGAVPFRWGGEEFLILLYGDKPYASAVMERIRKLIEETAVRYREQKIRITMTFGIAFCDERENPEKLIILADERMYDGKKNGKNRIVDI